MEPLQGTVAVERCPSLERRRGTGASVRRGWRETFAVVVEPGAGVARRTRGVGSPPRRGCQRYDAGAARVRSGRSGYLVSHRSDAEDSLYFSRFAVTAAIRVRRRSTSPRSASMQSASQACGCSTTSWHEGHCGDGSARRRPVRVVRRRSRASGRRVSAGGDCCDARGNVSAHWCRPATKPARPGRPKQLGDDLCPQLLHSQHGTTSVLRNRRAGSCQSRRSGVRVRRSRRRSGIDHAAPHPSQRNVTTASSSPTKQTLVPRQLRHELPDGLSFKSPSLARPSVSTAQQYGKDFAIEMLS